MMLETLTSWFVTRPPNFRLERFLYQTVYILHEVLGKDGSRRKRYVSSIHNLISEAHFIKRL